MAGVDTTMNPTHYSPDEKNILLQQKVQPHEPKVAWRSRSYHTKALALVVLLFVWSLYYFQPTAILKSRSQSKGCGSQKAGSLEQDFNSVGILVPIHVQHIANFSDRSK